MHVYTCTCICTNLKVNTENYQHKENGIEIRMFPTLGMGDMWAYCYSFHCIDSRCVRQPITRVAISSLEYTAASSLLFVKVLITF